MTTGELVIIVVAVSLNGGALLGFWAWARAAITKMQAEVATIKAQVASIEKDCSKQYDWLETTSKAVHATARNVVKLATAQGVGVERPE